MFVITIYFYLCQRITQLQTHCTMKELVEKINALCAAFEADAAKNVAGNKAAGARARKASLELEKAFKEFRKVSVEAGK